MSDDTEDNVSSADKNTDTPKATARADSAGADESTDSAPADEPSRADRPEPSRQVSVSLRTLWVSAVVVALVAALGIVTWLYIGAKKNLDDQARQAANATHAEQIALDYAVNAAIINFKDLNPWKQSLSKGTTPDLSKKLGEAATAMEQILLPLQWSSSAQPLAAKERSHDNGLYVVDAFVSVKTKTVQAAEDLQSTATYSITINSEDNWLITDVGGIGAVVGEK